MPYLDNKIEKEKHNANCWRGEVRRLYIRRWLKDKGKGKQQQVFVPWGLTCLECGVTVVNDEFRAKEKTPEQIEQRKQSEILIENLARSFRRRRMSYIEQLHDEQEEKAKEKQGLIQNAVLKMGKSYENKKVPKNKIFEKLKEVFGTYVSEADIEKFSLPEWKE